MNFSCPAIFAAVLVLLGAGASRAALSSVASAEEDVGDPQVKTDHPWYPGELSCSTFERLFATQAALFKRTTGKEVKTDEDKALASWMWRCMNYWHGEEGQQDYWGQGFEQGGDLWTRDYWTGLFAHGYGLCGTTHAQWIAEMNALLGPARGRTFGCVGHSSFEVFLTGGPYGAGKWVLLDHDISTVVFNKEGTALCSIPEIQQNLEWLTNRDNAPERQRNWPMCSYHKPAGSAYKEYASAGTYEGYAGPPPIVRLRRGESLRRYLRPGLEDGKTFVFWGRNYNTGGIPGPERWGAWVNQPERFYGNRDGAGYKEGQARFANAVYTYRPDFATDDHREGVVDESPRHVVLEFTTPYIIAATPPDDSAWGIYKPGGKNGLVLRGKVDGPVAVSVDQGKTWKDGGMFADGMDLTDHVKGHRQYFLRIGAGSKALEKSGLTITTVCQTSTSIIPRLKDGGTRVEFQASGKGIVSAGPTIAQGKARLVAGEFGTSSVTLGLTSPRREAPVAVYAAAHALSYTQPNPRVKYQIEASTDLGETWKPIVKDWQIIRHGDGPKSGWSQSFTWGSAEVASSPIQVRFSNDGKIEYRRAEIHLVYATGSKDRTRVTFDWTDDAGPHRESHVFPAGAPPPWELKTGKNVQTRWVEYAVVGR